MEYQHTTDHTMLKIHLKTARNHTENHTWNHKGYISLNPSKQATTVIYSHTEWLMTPATHISGYRAKPHKRLQKLADKHKTIELLVISTFSFKLLSQGFTRCCVVTNLYFVETPLLTSVSVNHYLLLFKCDLDLHDDLLQGQIICRKQLQHLFL